PNLECLLTGVRNNPRLSKPIRTYPNPKIFLDKTCGFELWTLDFGLAIRSYPQLSADFDFVATPISLCRCTPAIFGDSLRKAGADGRQFGKAVERFADGPGEATQQEQPKERVVKGPGVVARNRDEDAALALLAGPNQGLGFTL